MRARARVCKGILEERESRACKAASFAEYTARSGGGDGSGILRLSVGSSGGSSYLKSSRTASEAVACHLVWQYRGVCNLDVRVVRHNLVEFDAGRVGVVESN